MRYESRRNGEWFGIWDKEQEVWVLDEETAVICDNIVWELNHGCGGTREGAEVAENIIKAERTADNLDRALCRFEASQQEVKAGYE